MYFSLRSTTRQILRFALNDNKQGNSPLERGISGCTQILRRDAPLDDRKSENDKKERNHKSEIRNQIIMEKKEIWSKVLQVIITVLTAIATTFGVTSCMGM